MTNPPEWQRVFERTRQANEQRELQLKRDEYIRVFAGIYDRAEAYTQGIIAVGYVAIFATWAFVRDLMSPLQHAAAGLCLIISAATFTLWEVWSNISSANHVSELARRLRQSPEQAVPAVEQYEKAQREHGLSKLAGWRIVVSVTLGTGLVALGLMVWPLVGVLVQQLRS